MWNLNSKAQLWLKNRKGKIIFTNHDKCVFLHKNKFIMNDLNRITTNPNILHGQACIRGMRMPVSIILKLLSQKVTEKEILEYYPYLELEDIHQCLHYAAILASDEIHEFA